MAALTGNAPDVSGAIYDQKSQYDQIVPWLVGGERLYAVFDLKGSGTGFIALTNKRLMFYDKAFVGKRKALTSVPFNKITSVSSVDEGRGLFGATSELVVKASSEIFEFEFRGGDKAQRAYQLIMSEILQNEPA
jgi:Bacterial PH domain